MKVTVRKHDISEELFCWWSTEDSVRFSLVNYTKHIWLISKMRNTARISPFRFLSLSGYHNVMAHHKTSCGCNVTFVIFNEWLKITQSLFEKKKTCYWPIGSNISCLFKSHVLLLRTWKNTNYSIEFSVQLTSIAAKSIEKFTFRIFLW